MDVDSKYTYRVVLIMGGNRCLLEKQTQSSLEKEEKRIQVTITRRNSKEQISSVRCAKPLRHHVEIKTITLLPQTANVRPVKAA